MANNVLFSTLDGHIPLEDVLNWICKKNLEPDLDHQYGCNRADFILYFLNFLRQGTARTSPLPKCFLGANKSERKASQSKIGGEQMLHQKSLEKKSSHRVRLFLSPEEGGSPVKPVQNMDRRECHTTSTSDSQDGRNTHPRIYAKNHCLSSPSESHDNAYRTPLKTWKETEGRNPVHEVDSVATSSPVSCGSITHDGSPQLTPIQKRLQTSKSFEMRSPVFSPNSPDSGNRSTHKGTGFCLGDFIVKDGKGCRNPHGKKRVTGSPPKSPADLQNSVSDEMHLSNSNKKKHRRRINPTKLSVESNSSQTGFNESQSFGSLSQSLPLTSPFHDPANVEPAGASRSFTEERNLLKQERMKLLGDQFVSLNCSASLAPASKFTIPKSMILAEPSKVSFQDELLKCCSIYCCILDSNFIPNLMTEMYFVLQLLAIQDHHLESDENVLSTEIEKSLHNLSVDNSKESGELKDDSKDFENSQNPLKTCEPTDREFRSVWMFKSVHNCVFFATKVLFHLKNVLACLDRITLKLLWENERIADFSPGLRECLGTLYNHATSNIRSSGQVPCKSFFSSNVAFQSETDNSSNFPCAQSFSSFRKQRDGFYELIRIWEANHMSPGWCFTTALGSRVRNLLLLCNDPTNYMHLARLFRLQLIATVHGEPSMFDEETAENIQLQECLRGIDPDKLNRLRERLVTPRKSAGPRPPPSFPGIQEFYHDFIVCAYNSAFVQHLQDGLVSHLLELNQTVFVASDMEESDSSVDEVTRQEYLSTVSTMQLLAKFLGFVVFYPYTRPEGKLLEKIKDTEIALRSKVLPPIDVLSCVIEAHKNHRLIVTVPWIVKYLGMMDVVSSALPIYYTTLRVLLHIYIRLLHKVSDQMVHADGCEVLYTLSAHSVLLLRMCMGWLFEASTIQDAIFYSWCFNADDDALLDNINGRLAATTELPLSALNNSTGASLISNSGPPVDALNLVDGQILYALCPYLLELRVPLTSASVTRSTPGSSIRHITPVSTSLPASSPSSSKQLELQLEESFFHNLPASVHRTVEFVEERVTSLCVKHICNVWLRSLKEEGISKLCQKIESSWDDLDSLQDSLLKEVQAIVDEVSAELKLKCRSGIYEVCSTKCRGALLALLSEESLSPAVRDICVAIATRTCVERVVSWMQTHATLSMYGKELQSEIEKALKHRDRCDVVAMAKTSHIAPGSNAAWTHNDSAPSPFEVLQALKLMVCNILDGQETTKERIEEVLDKIKQTVTERQDVVPAAERVLALLSVDLVVALACHFPSILDSSLLNRMINLWKLDALRPVEDGLARLVCPRNMLLLAQSHHPPRIVWEKLADVVVAVLKADLVTPDLVENQCLAIMQQEWPQNILRCFSMCMTEVVRQYQKQRDVDYKFVLLLEWLAETMAQIEYFPDL